MRTKCLRISVLREASGPRVKLASCKSALNAVPPTPPPPHVVYSTDRYSGGPGVSLTLCCFVVYATRRFVLCLIMYYLFLCFSVLLALRLPRLGKRELILVLIVHLFDALVWFCLFSLPLGVWEGLRFVVMVLPGLFSYLFFLMV